MSNEENPYRSPASEDGGGSFEPMGDALRISARLLYRGWLFRLIQIIGDVEALVEYNGRWARETVSVNGSVAAKHWNFEPWPRLVPHFDLVIPCGDRFLPAMVDVRGVVSITAFRLIVAGVVVYCEGKW